MCSQPSRRERAGRDGRAGDEDLAVGGDAHARAEQRRPGAARSPSPSAATGVRRDLRAGLGQAVGEAHRHARRGARARAAPAGTGPPPVSAQRSAGGSLQAGVEQPRERRRDEADERDLPRCAARAARGRSRSARARPRSSRRSPSARGSTGRRRATAAARTASARAGRGRARRPSRARSTAGCRRSARPAAAPSVVPEVWIDDRGRVEVVARPPAARRRVGAARERLVDDDGARRRRCARARSADRRRSTGTATAPSSRQACSAWAKARPAGSAIATRVARADAARGELARARRCARGVQLGVGQLPAGVSQRDALRAAAPRRGEPCLDDHGAQASLRADEHHLDRRRADAGGVHRHPLREVRRRPTRASRRSRSPARRCATPSARTRSSRSPTRSRTRARTPRSA